MPKKTGTNFMKLPPPLPMNKILLIIFVLAILIFPAQEARAFIGFDVTETLGEGVLYANGLMTGFLGNALSYTAKGLGWFLKFQGSYFESITIVEESWKVFRDFTNMFFILILIVIAFATIFDMQQYNWKGLMAKFIIAALLINFSLAIGGFIIKASNTLSNVALSQFSDITANLAGGFGLNKLITNAGTITGQTSGDLLANAISSHIISSIGIIIVTAIVLLSFVSAFAFSVARVPVLWALLIVSPIAWISYILPQTRKIWSDWWKHFLCWTFFMPAYLFSLVMGIAILNNRPDVETAIKMSGGTTLLSATGNFIGFTVQEIFFYVLTVIILVGGLAVSLKMACAAGTGVAKTMGAINDRVQKLTYVSALRKGAKEKLAEIQKTGLPGKLGAIYGGERAEKLKEARVAERFLGERGAVQAEKDRVLREDIKTYKDRFKATTNVDELRQNAKLGPQAQQLAIRELLKERGELKANEIIETYQLYGGNETMAGLEFAKSIEYDKLSKEERKQLYDRMGLENAEVARKIVTTMADKGDWRTEEGPDLVKKLEQYASLFSQEGDKGDFLNKAMKFNFEEAVRAKVNMNNADPAKEQQNLIGEMEKTIKRMNIDKLTELSAGTLRKLLENPDTKRMVSDKITKDTVSSIAGKLTGDQLEILKPIIDSKEAQFKTEAKEGDELRKIRELLERQAGTQSGSSGTTPPAPPQPRKPVGFVPPGSTVSGGEVKTPEGNINPNNVLDLRNKK
ncbi:MAG: Uncharacterized protein G01um101444_383 [Parcubacteria group bacterium Gr01-1014_44]|nr:MAG: Uncharacterized protein G01um101444_383 [Parcubacteria group bacterium Gr01-1014_44]